MLPDSRELAVRRRQLGLTQTQLAREADVSQSLVAKLEAGKADASYSRVKSLFDALARLEAEGSLKAGDVMHRGVKSARSGEPAVKAARLMKNNGLSQLPVVRDGVIVGSVSESILLDAVARGVDLHSMPVGEIMGECFPQVSPATPFQSVLELLKSHPAVLVSSRGAVKGIVTKADALDASK
ncbi:MAG: CBS domain-containing protein [Candidatus Micrarchaeia archaeon]